MLVLGIYPVEEPECRRWMWHFKIRIHIFLHDQAFSNSVLFSVFRAILHICSPQDLLWAFVILFSSYLSIRPFCHILSVPIFFSQIFWLPLHSVICLFLWCILHHLFGRIFFCYFVISCFVCIAWSCHNFFFEFPFFCQNLLIYIFK